MPRLIKFQVKFTMANLWPFQLHRICEHRLDISAKQALRIIRFRY